MCREGGLAISLNVLVSATMTEEYTGSAHPVIMPAASLSEVSTLY